MAANPPYEGAVFVPGTMEEVGLALLAKATDPKDVVAYAGYGFWVPSALATKTKGAKATEITNAPVAPNFNAGPEQAGDPGYQDIVTNDDGAAIDDNTQPGQIPAVVEANAPLEQPVPDEIDENTAAADDSSPVANQPVIDADAAPAEADPAANAPLEQPVPETVDENTAAADPVVTPTPADTTAEAASASA